MLERYDININGLLDTSLSIDNSTEQSAINEQSNDMIQAITQLISNFTLKINKNEQIIIEIETNLQQNITQNNIINKKNNILKDNNILLNNEKKILLNEINAIKLELNNQKLLNIKTNENVSLINNNNNCEIQSLEEENIELLNENQELRKQIIQLKSNNNQLKFDTKIDLKLNVLSNNNNIETENINNNNSLIETVNSLSEITEIKEQTTNIVKENRKRQFGDIITENTSNNNANVNASAVKVRRVRSKVSQLELSNKEENDNSITGAPECSQS